MAEPDNYNYPQFFTATILEWKHLMSADAYKDIVLNSLLFLKNEKMHRGLWLCNNAQPHSFVVADSAWFQAGCHPNEIFEIYCPANEISFSQD